VIFFRRGKHERVLRAETAHSKFTARRPPGELPSGVRRSSKKRERVLELSIIASGRIVAVIGS